MPSPKSAVRETVVYKTVVKGGVSASSIIAALGSQAANQVLASPNGSNGAMSVRALVNNDIPNLPASKITSGTFDTARIPNLPISHITSLQTALDALQPLDSDLTVIAGLTPSNDDLIQRKAGVWTNRTPAQLKTDLAIASGDVSGLGTMATQNANAVAITGGSAAFTATLSNTLSDTATNSISAVLTLGHNSSNTPAAGFGSRILLQLESNTTENRDAAAIDVLWTTTTDATRTSRMDFYVTSSGTLTSIARVTPSSFEPSSNNAIQLGSGSFRWSAAYINSVFLDSAQNHVLLDGGTSAGIINRVTSSDTAAATRHLYDIQYRSSGTPAAGFGGLFAIQLKSSTNNDRDAFGLESSWVVATDASRTARARLLAYDSSGAREAIRFEASGSAPMIGFLGAAAVIRQALGAWAGLTTDQKLDALRDALTNLGLTSYT